jgi:hypothetical protein
MLERLNNALPSVGLPRLPIMGEEFSKPDKRIALINRMLNVELLTPPTGLPFDEHWNGAEQARMAGTSVVVRVGSISTLARLLRIAHGREITRAQVFAEDLELLAGVGR